MRHVKKMKQFYQLLFAVLIFCVLILVSCLTASAAEPRSAAGLPESGELPQDSELPPDIFDEYCDGGASCPGRIFTDMPPADNWAHLPIDWALTRHITRGTGPDTFSPGKGCTRAEIVMFLWRAFGSQEPNSTDCPFEDVRSDDYFYTAVLWASENGYVSGTGANSFSPSLACSRAQTMTFLWAAAGKPIVTQSDIAFRDVPANAYYYQAVCWAFQNHITSGLQSDLFGSDVICTRAQVVTFLYKLMKLS